MRVSRICRFRLGREGVSYELRLEGDGGRGEVTYLGRVPRRASACRRGRCSWGVLALAVHCEGMGLP